VRICTTIVISRGIYAPKMVFACIYLMKTHWVGLGKAGGEFLSLRQKVRIICTRKTHTIYTQKLFLAYKWHENELSWDRTRINNNFQRCRLLKSTFQGAIEDLSPLSNETVDKQKKKITLLTLEVCLITPFYRTESRLTECWRSFLNKPDYSCCRDV